MSNNRVDVYTQEDRDREYKGKMWMMKQFFNALPVAFFVSGIIFIFAEQWQFSLGYPLLIIGIILIVIQIVTKLRRR